MTIVDGFYTWNKTDPRENLTTHFSTAEFTCNCKNLSCKEQKIEVKLVAKLQKLRDQLKKPLQVHSGYRCAAHNKAIGGAKNSNHVKGQAVDIQSLVKILDLPKFLEEYDLYTEDPTQTLTWQHLQTVVPKSKKRIFSP